MADDLPRTAFSYYQALPGTYPPPVESDPVQRVNSEIVRAHYASLQPDAVVTASVMEGFLLGDHCPAPPGLPGVVEAAVLYDLIPLVLAGDFLTDPLYAAFYRRQVEVLKKADLLLAISRSSREDAIRLLGLGESRVAHIGAAVDPKFELTPRAPRGAALPGAPYILFAGGIDRNKSIGLAIEAFARLPATLRTEHSLLHVGSLPAEGRQEARTAGRGSRHSGSPLSWDSWRTKS